MRKISVKQRALLDKHSGVVAMYKSGKFTTEFIAKTYNLSPRAIQRIAHKYGVIRTQAEANRIAAPLKNYHHVPEHLKVKRKHISRKIRYLIIDEHPFCNKCGKRVIDGVRLEVDHIDENAENNDLTNLQVLCNLCNQGKSQLHRFPVK